MNSTENNFDTRTISSPPIIMKDGALATIVKILHLRDFGYPFFILKILDTTEYGYLDSNCIHSSFEKKVFEKKKKYVLFYDLPYVVGCSVSCYSIFPVGSFREINLIFFPLVNFSRFLGIYFCFLATKEKIFDTKINLDSNNVNDFRDLEFPSYKTELKN